MNVHVMAQDASNLLVKRYMGPFWHRRRWLNRTQWLDRSSLEAVQRTLLNKLLKHCYKTVPFYRERMDDLKISVERPLPLEIVREFPVLTKADILSAKDTLISRKYPRWSLHTAYTGGSTGPRLPLRRDFVSIGNEHAFVRRQFDWAGIRMSEPCAYLTWRSVADPNDPSQKPYAYAPLMKELILSTFHLSAAMVDDYLAAMRERHVQAIVGYPSAVYEIAKVLTSQGRTFPLRAAMTSSETLGPEQRQTIEEAFVCPVYDYYGSAERVCYIHTCEKGSYHIVPEYGLTELIPCEAPNDDCCRLIATGFWNYAMPLIRYDTGDLVRVSRSECSCGRAFEVVDSIAGRACQTIQTSGGRVIGLTAMARLLKNVLICLARLPVVDSRFILDDGNTIAFEYIPKQQFTEEDGKQIQTIMARELPDDLNVVIRKVNTFDRTASGKIISLVQS